MERNYATIFRVINIIIAAVVIAGGIVTCVPGDFPNVIQGIFVILFGIMTIVFEFRLPRAIVQFASFMFSFLGRGIFFIFIGCITLGYGAVGIAFGVIIIVSGIAYSVIHFLNLEPPSNMRMSTFEDTLKGTGPTHSDGTVEATGAV